MLLLVEATVMGDELPCQHIWSSPRWSPSVDPALPLGRSDSGVRCAGDSGNGAGRQGVEDIGPVIRVVSGRPSHARPWRLGGVETND